MESMTPSATAASPSPWGYNPRCRPTRREPAARGDAPFPRGWVLGGEPSTAAALHIRGQLTHRSLCDLDAFAPVNRDLGSIDGGKNFRPAALAFDPEAHCLL